MNTCLPSWRNRPVINHHDRHNTGSIATDGSLVVDGHEVSVVYYRAGCDPSDESDRCQAHLLSKPVRASALTVLDGDLSSEAGLFSRPRRYSPDDFPTETEWTGREILERSTAVKCPSLRRGRKPPPPRCVRSNASGEDALCFRLVRLPPGVLTLSASP